MAEFCPDHGRFAIAPAGLKMLSLPALQAQKSDETPVPRRQGHRAMLNGSYIPSTAGEHSL